MHVTHNAGLVALSVAIAGIWGMHFVGMLAASTVGIFLIPMLYVAAQRLRERTQGKSKDNAVPHMQPAE